MQGEVRMGLGKGCGLRDRTPFAKGGIQRQKSYTIELGQVLWDLGRSGDAWIIEELAQSPCRDTSLLGTSLLGALVKLLPFSGPPFPGP